MLEIFQGDEKISRIYRHIADDYSKEMFGYRLLYTLTGDLCYGQKLVEMTKEGKSFFEKLENNKKGMLVMFGTGFWAKEIVRTIVGVKWKYYVDNNKDNVGKDINGIKVISFDDLCKIKDNATVVIGSRLYEDEIYKQLISNGFDDNSIINAGKMIGIQQDEQYFDLQELNLSSMRTFVDGGCCDGKSSVNFYNMCSKKNVHIWAFEPDKYNRTKCENNLSRLNAEINIMAKGVWDDTGVLRFDGDKAGCSEINNSGKNEIEVTSLDNELKDNKIDYIKFDIEGSELNGIEGAKKIISIQRPALAICVYHRSDDILQIPLKILDYNNNYKFYLRHYSLGTYDTVLYAIGV